MMCECDPDTVSTLDHQAKEMVGWIRCSCGEINDEVWRIPYQAEYRETSMEQLRAEWNPDRE